MLLSPYQVFKSETLMYPDANLGPKQRVTDRNTRTVQ